MTLLLTYCILSCAMGLMGNGSESTLCTSSLNLETKKCSPVNQLKHTGMQWGLWVMVSEATLCTSSLNLETRKCSPVNQLQHMQHMSMRVSKMSELPSDQWEPLLSVV